MSYEPFSDGGLLIQSGVPVQIKDTGGQGYWIRVPQPAPGEVGEILTVQPDLSADWEPASGGGGLQTVTYTFTNAELRSTTPITLVPAQGTRTIIVPVRSTLILLYGGTNAWANNPTWDIRYNNNVAAATSLGNPGWTSTASRAATQSVGGVTSNLSLQENQPLTVGLDIAATGNAANDNTAFMELSYYVSTY